MTGYNNRMRATDRFLAKYLGRVKSGKPDEFYSPITQPLERDVARLIRPSLNEEKFRYFLPQDASELAGITAKDIEVPIHYQAGFGCRVFSVDYRPEDEDGVVPPLIANPPRHGCSCEDATCVCGNKNYLVRLQKMRDVLRE